MLLSATPLVQQNTARLEQDRAQRMAALDIGGQIMSTDYPPLKGEKNPFSFALSGAKKNYLLSALD